MKPLFLIGLIVLALGLLATPGAVAEPVPDPSKYTGCDIDEVRCNLEYVTNEIFNGPCICPPPQKPW